MNRQIEERIQIANEFKSKVDWKNESLENKIQKLRIAGFFNFVFTNFLFLLVIVMSILAFFHIEPFHQNWQKSGLIILVSASISIHAPFYYIEYLLLKHSKQIMNLDVESDNSLNDELSNLINMLIKRGKIYYVLYSPVIVIVIGTIFQVSKSTPILSVCLYFILILSSFLIFELAYLAHLTRRNLKKFEFISPN